MMQAIVVEKRRKKFERRVNQMLGEGWKVLNEEGKFLNLFMGSNKLLAMILSREDDSGKPPG